MERFVWDDEVHGIGHALIDVQHQRLAEVVNELVELSEDGHTETQLIHAVTKMMWYADDHFETEEAFMHSIKAPILDAQKDADREFMEGVNQMMHNSTWRDIDSVVQFLKDWLTTHIMITAFQFSHRFSEAA